MTRRETWAIESRRDGLHDWLPVAFEETEALARTRLAAFEQASPAANEPGRERRACRYVPEPEQSAGHRRGCPLYPARVCTCTESRP